MANKPTHSGPGRGTPRTRAAARPGRTTSRTARPNSRNKGGKSSASRVLTPSAVPRLVRSVGFTRRAIALMVVLAILVLSYASSLRVYLRQERQLAQAEQQVAERTAANASLDSEISRWSDQDYVKAQARQRLGWVVPGETGYRVIDANGQPLDSGVTITSTSTLPEGEHPTQWWDRLSGSLSTADQPLVASASSQSTVTVSPTPTPTPTKKS